MSIEVEYLQGQLDATQSLLDRAMALIPDPDDLALVISMAKDNFGLLAGEREAIERLDQIWMRL